MSTDPQGRTPENALIAHVSASPATPLPSAFDLAFSIDGNKGNTDEVDAHRTPSPQPLNSLVDTCPPTPRIQPRTAADYATPEPIREERDDDESTELPVSQQEWKGEEWGWRAARENVEREHGSQAKEAKDEMKDEETSLSRPPLPPRLGLAPTSGPTRQQTTDSSASSPGNPKRSLDALHEAKSTEAVTELNRAAADSYQSTPSSDPVLPLHRDDKLPLQHYIGSNTHLRIRQRSRADQHSQLAQGTMEIGMDAERNQGEEGAGTRKEVDVGDKGSAVSKISKRLTGEADEEDEVTREGEHRGRPRLMVKLKFGDLLPSTPSPLTPLPSSACDVFPPLHHSQTPSLSPPAIGAGQRRSAKALRTAMQGYACPVSNGVKATIEPGIHDHIAVDRTRRAVSVREGGFVEKGETLLWARPPIAVLHTVLLETHCSGCMKGPRQIAEETGCDEMKTRERLLKCAKCREVVFCSTKCYASSAQEHFRECELLRKSACAAIEEPLSAEVRLIARACLARRTGEMVALPAYEPVAHTAVPPTSDPMKREVQALAVETACFLQGTLSSKGLSWATYGFRDLDHVFLFIRRILACRFEIQDAACTPLGWCISPVISHIKHSCTPNSFIVYPFGTAVEAPLRVIANRDLSEGEELTVAYHDLGLPDHRRIEVTESYGFSLCACARCKVKGNVDGRWMGKHTCKGEGLVPILGVIGEKQAKCTQCGETAFVDLNETPYDAIIAKLEPSIEAAFQGKLLPAAFMEEDDETAQDREARLLSAYHDEGATIATEIDHLLEYFPETFWPLGHLHLRLGMTLMEIINLEARREREKAKLAEVALRSGRTTVGTKSPAMVRGSTTIHDYTLAIEHFDSALAALREWYRGHAPPILVTVGLLKVECNMRAIGEVLNSLPSPEAGKGGPGSAAPDAPTVDASAIGDIPSKQATDEREEDRADGSSRATAKVIKKARTLAAIETDVSSAQAYCSILDAIRTASTSVKAMLVEAGADGDGLKGCGGVMIDKLARYRLRIAKIDHWLKGEEDAKRRKIRALSVERMRAAGGKRRGTGKVRGKGGRRPSGDEFKERKRSVGGAWADAKRDKLLKRRGITRVQDDIESETDEYEIGGAESSVGGYAMIRDQAEKGQLGLDGTVTPFTGDVAKLLQALDIFSQSTSKIESAGSGSTSKVDSPNEDLQQQSPCATLASSIHASSLKPAADLATDADEKEVDSALGSVSL